jgi:hypothetical protein
MAKESMTLIFDSSGCKIYYSSDCKVCGDVKVTASEIGGIYRLDVFPELANLASSKDSQELWHRRLGHLSRYYMRQLQDGMVTGISYVGGDASPCVSCVMGKQTRQPFSKVKGK